MSREKTRGKTVAILVWWGELQGSGSKNHSAIIDYRRKAIGGIGKVKVNELPKPREGRRTTYLRMRLRGDRQRIVIAHLVGAMGD